MKHTSLPLLAGVFAFGCLACQAEVPTTGSTATDVGFPSDAFAGDSSANVPPAVYPTDDAPPVVVLASPTAGSQLTGQTVLVSGVASDDVGVAAISIAAGANLPRAAQTINWRTGAFESPVALGPGPQTIVVTVWDIAGNTATASVDVVVDLGTDNAPPTVAITSPQDGFTSAFGTVLLRGTTSDDLGVASVEVRVNDGSSAVAGTDDQFATWAYSAPLLPGVENTITVTARDSAGRTAIATITGTTSVIADDAPPEVTIEAPADGEETDADAIVVRGTARDPSGITSVDVRVGNGAYQGAASSDGFATWQRTVPLLPGENIIKVRARDGSGLQATTEVRVVNTSGELWGPARTYTLSWTAPSHESSALTVNRTGMQQLIPEAIAKELVMLELDLRPLMTSAANAIRNGCGSGWETKDRSDNCPPSWGQPEKNLYRLLTMTPANVNVDGTSIEGLSELASILSAIGLLDTFGEILAATLGIPETGLIVDSEAVVDALLADLIGTHPNARPDGLVDVTMWDAMRDMETLASRFDAVGDHPGFLDTTFGTTYAQVLSDDFTMTLVAKSNLHWHDGVDFGVGKAYLATIADTTGPTFDDVVEFDFLGEETFQVTGLVDAPVVDMTFKAEENDAWIPIGTSMNPMPRGNSSVWELPKWELEYVLADASFRFYKDHRGGCSYCSGSSSGALLFEDPIFGLDEAELVVGEQGYDKGLDGELEHFDHIDPNPAGWLRIWTLANLGTPPEPQYVWDMILEVAERRLLDGGVDQGEGGVLFPLHDIPVGLTGDEVKAAVRPVLEGQKSKLSEMLLGDYRQSAGAIDFYFARGSDGAFRLYFVRPGDPVPDGATTHTKPGFFSDEALTNKVSSTADGGSGDTTHEKLTLGPEPQTVYCQDGSGKTFRVQVSASEGPSVDVTLRELLGGTP